VRNQDALNFWHARIAQGKRFVAVGGSDWHHFSQLEQTPPRAPGTPTLWVRVEETPSANTILDAMRHGHVSLSNAPDGAFLELRAGKELAAHAGDVLNCEDDLFVHVRCLRGKGNTLQLLDQTRVLYTQTISRIKESVQTRVNVAQSNFVRAELRDANGDMQALTNPIYFRK
jgi:hypothetical protein